MESSDQLDELFADGNEFTLHRLLSDFTVNDMNIDMNDIVKLDPMKLFDNRSFSEFLQYESLDQTNPMLDIPSDQIDTIPSSATIACSSGSLSEFCPPTPELSSKDIYQHLKMEPEHSLTFTELDSSDIFAMTPTTSTPLSQEFSFDPCVLANFEHDFGNLSKRSTIVQTPSPSPIIAKRTSSRLQSRTTINNNPSTLSSIKKAKIHHVHRATDIKTEDDLSYYLERRRKNNEASKLSRASRKLKYGDMDARCIEYERVNAELRLKIATLETVTADLKNGLIHCFQRKGGVNSNS